MAAISVMGTLAYLSNNTSAVKNTFVAAGGGKLVADDTSDFTLTEHTAQYNTTGDNAGAYTLADTVASAGNTYDKVAPNMAIPKDPTLHLNLVNGAEAYVFVVVTDDLAGDNQFSYSLTGNWKDVTSAVTTALGEGKSVKTGVKIYAYGDSGNAAGKMVTGTDAAELDKVQILTGGTNVNTSGQITVADATSLTTKSGGTGGAMGDLTFQAYLAQGQGFSSAAAAFAACFGENVTAATESGD